VSARGNKAEQALDYAVDGFGKITLMAQWNTFMKSLSGTFIQDTILGLSETAAKGGKLSAKHKASLARMGLDEADLKNIAIEFAANGRSEQGVRYAGISNWSNKELANTYNNALGREVDRVIVTPTVGQKPLWFSSQSGKILTQFKSFVMSSQQNILLPAAQMPNGKGELLALIGMSSSMGVLAYTVKQLASGKEVETDPNKLLVEGIDKSGVMSIFMEMNNMSDKITDNKFSLQSALGTSGSSRFGSRNELGALLGPSFGRVQDTIDVVGDVASEDGFKSKDTRKIRKQLPYQNLIGLRLLLNEAEEIFNETVGVPK
jgi:hypothetical protein